MNNGTNCINVEGKLFFVYPKKRTSKGSEYLPVVVDVLGIRWSQFLDIRIQNDEKFDEIQATEIGSKVTVQVEIMGWKSETKDGFKTFGYLRGIDLHWGWFSDLTKEEENGKS